MIEGLKVQVPGFELQKRLADRIVWHEQKAEVLAKKRTALQSVTAEMRKTLSVDIEDESELDDLVEKSSYIGTARQYLGQVVDHQKRADFLRFFSDHIDPNETYLVSEQELTYFEIIGR